MLRTICIKRTRQTDLMEWLTQVEIQWQLLDKFKASAQAQFHIQEEALTAATAQTHLE